MATYQPTLEEFQRLAGGGANLIPVYREVEADLETPVSAYLKVARGPHSFLLESVEGGERLARYSFIGTEPYRVLRTGPGQPDGARDPLPIIEAELARFTPVAVKGLPPFVGGAVGYLAFECVRYFEPRVPSPESDPIGVPEAVFLFTDTLLVFDHLKHKIQVVSHARLPKAASAPKAASGGAPKAAPKTAALDAAYREAVERIDALAERLHAPLAPPAHQGRPTTGDPAGRSNKTDEDYTWMVGRAREYIIAGDVIQVVPSQRIARPTTATPFELYRALRAVNPSPYMYYLGLEDFAIVGASPEMLVRVEDGRVDTHPIAGTRRRGATDEEDQSLEQDLRHDEKERAEHVMLLDLGRNDIGRVAKPGSVKVTQMLDVERYSHVMHLVSHVTGELAEGKSVYDALRSCFPAGTVSGAPKIRAMEIISELERERRGPYAGAVGYFSFDGNMDTAIAIRTMVVKDGVAYIQAGGGVVYDSEPAFERAESLQKATASLRAIAEAEGRG